jgi:hypothetical protein
MIWLWYDTGDRTAVADYTQSAFWYFLPTMPMFLIIPALLRHGVTFWLALAAGLAVTMLLYVVMNRLLAGFGVML